MNNTLDALALYFALCLVKPSVREALAATDGEGSQKQAAAVAAATQLVTFLRRSYTFRRNGTEVVRDSEIAEHLAPVLRHLTPEIAEAYAASDITRRQTACNLIAAMLAGAANTRFEIVRAPPEHPVK